MNRMTSILDIKYPIIQGGMGNISNADLTAAVSEAGGLGTVGAGTMPVNEVEKIILETKARTSRPFSLNVALSVCANPVEILQLAVRHKVPVVTLSAGNPSPFIPNLQKAGITVIAVVASVKQAEKAEAGGADLIVAEGYEAAGINSNLETTTLALIPQIVRAVKIPVVAAGGIADGFGLLAMLALGASGVQMGTRFIATQEAPFHKTYKQKLLKATDHETVIVGRSVGRIRRLLNTPYSLKVLAAEKQGITLDEFAELTSEELHKKGAIEGDEEQGFMNGGQVSGLISDLPTVKELLERMMKEAKIQLDSISHQL